MMMMTSDDDDNDELIMPILSYITRFIQTELLTYHSEFKSEFETAIFLIVLQSAELQRVSGITRCHVLNLCQVSTQVD